MPVIICRECDAVMPSDARMCRHCGTRVLVVKPPPGIRLFHVLAIVGIALSFVVLYHLIHLIVQQVIRR